MGYWVEAWTFPWETPFERKIAYLPVLNGTNFNLEYDKGKAMGTIILPKNYARINEVHYVDENNHTNDRGSLIRFYRRGVPSLANPEPVFEFFTETREEDSVNTATGTVTITGREITSAALNRAMVLPFDFPVFPTRDPDWTFGGKNLLSDPGFEEPIGTNEATLLSISGGATGGSWTMTYGGQTTAAISYPTSSSALKSAIEALSNINSVDIDGEGTPENPWIITVTDPGDNFDVSANGASLTGGTPIVTLFEKVRGGLLVPSPAWQKSHNPVSGIHHGEHELFQVGLNDPDTGIYSLRMDPFPGGFPGVQQMIRIEPGRQYYAHARYRPESANDAFRLVIRDTLDSYTPVAEAVPRAQTGTALVYNDITIDPFVMWDSLEEVIFRFAFVNEADRVSCRLDTCFFGLGQPPATIGKIWRLLFEDVTVNHIGSAPVVLDWLTFTFDDNVDSNGNPWVLELDVTIGQDTPYNELAEDFFARWGYEHRIRWNQALSQYEFDVYISGGMGTSVDHSITIGSNVTGGPIAMRAPRSNWWKVSGADGTYHIDDAPDLSSAWGPSMEGFDIESSDLPSLQQITAQADLDIRSQMFGTRVTMTDDDSQQTVPVRDFREGDYVTSNFGTRAAKRERRCVSITVTLGDRGRANDIQVGLSSSVYSSSGIAGMGEGVRRLLRRRISKLEERVGRSLPAVTQTPTSTVSQPALFRVAGNIFPASDSGQDIPWELVNDPDGIIAGIEGGTEIMFATPGLYHIAWTIYAEWSSTTSGWAQWQLLPALWKGGGQLVEGSWGPWEVWSHDDASGIIVMKATVSHLVEVRDTSHVYITGYSLINEDPSGFLDTGTGTIFGGP